MGEIIPLEEFINRQLYGANGFYNQPGVIGPNEDNAFSTVSYCEYFQRLIGEVIENYTQKEGIDPRDLCVVELGPGEGELMKCILEEYPGINYYVIEKSKYLSKRIKEKYGKNTRI